MSALLAVIVSVSIVVADPVIVAFLASSCVWIFEETPSKYPSSVDVTSDTATFPLPSVMSALLAVIVSVSIVVADPVMLPLFASNCVWMFEVTPST